jgi:general secretion pathway protein H
MPRRPAGFTLIELMVVLVIIGVMLGAVGLSIRSADRSLQFEAERLAQLLSLAREEAQVRGAPIRLDADEQGFRFMIRRDRQWQPILDDRDLRERAWEGPTTLRIERPDGQEGIEFGREQVDAPFVLRLTRDKTSAAIAANGLGSFVLQ